MLVAAVFFFYAFPLSDYLRSPTDQSLGSPSPTRQMEHSHRGQHHHHGESGAEGPLIGSKVCVVYAQDIACFFISIDRGN